MTPLPDFHTRANARSYPKISEKLLLKILNKIEIVDGCWSWQGCKTDRGYGQMSVNYNMYKLHRLVYRYFMGQPDQSKVIDHKCRNRACLNPAHMRVVTNKENVLSGVGLTAKFANQTHCKRGHEFTKENTYVYFRNGRRECKQCSRAYKNKSAKKRRQTLAEQASLEKEMGEI